MRQPAGFFYTVLCLSFITDIYRQKILTTLTRYIKFNFKKNLTIILDDFCQEIYMTLFILPGRSSFQHKSKKGRVKNPAFLGWQ